MNNSIFGYYYLAFSAFLNFWILVFSLPFSRLTESETNKYRESRLQKLRNKVHVLSFLYLSPCQKQNSLFPSANSIFSLFLVLPKTKLLFSSATFYLFFISRPAKYLFFQVHIISFLHLDWTSNFNNYLYPTPVTGVCMNVLSHVQFSPWNFVFHWIHTYIHFFFKDFQSQFSIFVY